MTIGTQGDRRAMTAPPSFLDYYVVLREAAGRVPATEAEGVVVEEFVHAPDWSTVGLRGAGWTPDAGWWSAAPVSHAMRRDPRTRARVVPVTRAGADAAHRRLAGRPLPDEPVLRGHLHEHQAFPAATPLRLGPADAPEGFHERRVYRVLFAGDPPTKRWGDLAGRWQATADGRRGEGGPAGARRVGADDYRWTVRPVGSGIAWALDLTALLATADDRTVGPVLRELTSDVRLRGLVPVTTERFA